MNHWLFVLLVVLHVFVCLLLVLLILLQNDKGGGLAGAFGGMGGGAAFTGSSAATFLTKITQGIALVSFILLLSLNYMSTQGIASGQRESELKGARKGLSSVLPGGQAPSNGAVQGSGEGQAPVNAIPGLGAPASEAAPVAPAAPAAGEPAPVKGQ